MVNVVNLGLICEVGVGDVDVRVALSPPWTPDRMTKEARDELGMFLSNLHQGVAGAMGKLRLPMAPMNTLH